MNETKAFRIHWNGVLRYLGDFISPSVVSAYCFSNMEREKAMHTQPRESFGDYLELLQFNMEIGMKGFAGSLTSMMDYHLGLGNESIEAALNTFHGKDGEDIADYTARRGCQGHRHPESKMPKKKEEGGMIRSVYSAP